VVDTAGLSPAKTELANLLAEKVRELPEAIVLELIERMAGRGPSKPPET
jgi:hypothetical protein